jgi:hypothetical protein
MSAHKKLFKTVFASLFTVMAMFTVGNSLRAQVKDAPKNVSAPEVVFQVVAERDSLHRGESVITSVIVTNRSAIVVRILQLSLLQNNSGFSSDAPSPALEVVPAYGTEIREMPVKAGDNSEYQLHHLAFKLEYIWNDGTADHHSAQTASINLQVARQFEDEAKGLPGGTAALLYLILPIMTIFFAYQIVESLRKGEGLKVPEFKAAYLAPAFLLAICVNFYMVVEWKKDQGYLYSDPERFAWFLLILTGAGSLIPGTRWILQGLHWRKFAFREDDTMKEYLRKALAQSQSNDFQWGTGTFGGQEWEGVLLQQPDGKTVLGARLQVIPKPDAGTTSDALKQIVDAKGNILNTEKLLELVRSDAVDLNFQEKISQGGIRLNKLAAVKRVAGFTANTRVAKPILTLLE